MTGGTDEMSGRLRALFTVIASSTVSCKREEKCYNYRIRPIKRTVTNKRTPLFFTVRGGMASAIVMKNL